MVLKRHAVRIRGIDEDHVFQKRHSGTIPGFRVWISDFPDYLRDFRFGLREKNQFLCCGAVQTDFRKGIFSGKGVEQRRFSGTRRTDERDHEFFFKARFHRADPVHCFTTLPDQCRPRPPQGRLFYGVFHAADALQRRFQATCGLNTGKVRVRYHGCPPLDPSRNRSKWTGSFPSTVRRRKGLDGSVQGSPR